MIRVVCIYCTNNTLLFTEWEITSISLVFGHFATICSLILRFYCKTCGLRELLKTIYDHHNRTVCSKLPQFITTRLKKNFLIRLLLWDSFYTEISKMPILPYLPFKPLIIFMCYLYKIIYLLLPYSALYTYIYIAYNPPTYNII